MYWYSRSFETASLWSDDEIREGVLELTGDHVGAIVGFATTRGEKVNVKVASSFISHARAELNLREIGEDDFDTLKARGREIWNRELGRVRVSGGTVDQTSTFYTTLRRTLLFPRKFYEYDEDGNIMHYSPYNGEVLPGYLFTDTGLWDTFRVVFHDVQGLMDLMGGREALVSMLDSVFVLPPVFDDSYYGSHIHEIREIQIAEMGLYALAISPYSI